MINHQHTGLKKSFRMFDLPVCTALQKLGFSAAGVEGQPISLVTNARDFLVRVSDVFKIKIPVGMCLIRKVLWLAGYSEDLTTCRTNLVDNTVVNIAP